ncbi:hypothetical protein Q6A83_04145 [Aliarcobacter skirrowii]|uniref:hypothetical protein n=1 Tax=Aliarcobacter skirrowii TaxID=28200 RepID=UPI0029BA3FD6|nr:hypothetical protein [Aliarcobacter skirrowii]MDX4049964.1 hypothetical protein [Aliarcobacter skirrowii]
MSGFSGFLGTIAIEGGTLVVLENDYDVIAEIKVPEPYLGAEKDSDSTVTEEDGFTDSFGNSYSISVSSSMYGGIDYEIEPEDVVNEEGLETFKSNIKVFFEEPEPPFDPWEYFSPEEIETGYEKRLRWSNELIEKEFYEVSIIINVSSLETLMKDLFKSNSKHWFHYISEDELDTKIFQFLNVYKLKDSFLHGLMKTPASSREEKIKVLEHSIKDKLRNIDFQKTENQGSFNWLFNLVFDINIDVFLQSEEIENKKLKEHFNEMYILRHKLIHGVDTHESIEKNESTLYYNVTKKVSDFLLEKMARLNRTRIGSFFR